MSDRFEYLEFGDEPARRRPAARDVGRAADAASGVWRIVEEIGGPGTRFGQFHAPHGLAVDAQEHLYVADTGNHRVQRIAPNGDVLCIGRAGRDRGEFRRPLAVAVDGSGQLYVADSENARVQVLAPDGEPRRILGGFGGGAAQFRLPVAVAIAPDGDLLVVDQGNRRIARWLARGYPIDIVARFGRSTEFVKPAAIAVGRSGRIYVADRGLRALLAFDAHLRFEGMIGAPGQFCHDPCALACGADETLFVADGVADQIVILGPDRLRAIVVQTAAGEPLVDPAGIAVAPSGSVYVADTGRHRLLRMERQGA